MQAASQPKTRPKAIALMSGGLDSALAAKIIKDQGVEVIGLHLLSPFGCRTDVEKCGAAIGVNVLFKEKGEAYLDLVENPRYGYGKNMNPCIDCRVFMFQLAEVVMRDEGADFVVTGEVLGQRPMSQQRHAIDLIDKNSGLKGLLLRPLSAHLFEPTIPEQKGWVKREMLFDISGRSRKEQFALAEKLGIQEYEQPGGGCLLTESAFSNKLRDWIKNPSYRNSEERMAQSAMLRFGRHFRMSDSVRVILGRDEKENEELARLWQKAGGIHCVPANFDGPSAVVFGPFGDAEKKSVSALISRYSKIPDISDKEIGCETPEGQQVIVGLEPPISEERLTSWRL